MRRHAQDGKEHPRKAFVFGNDAGERVKSIRTAWEKTCKRAGIDPRELHFHDLRANLLLGCWNRRQTCTTCATSSGTRT